jgi:hypothetical protein
MRHDGGSAENVIRVVARCPTGALAPTRRRASRAMLLDSVEALFDELGDWPNDADYAAILNAEVLLRSKLGVGDVEFFSVSAFNDTFGSYGEGRQATERRFAERARLREQQAGSPSTDTPRNARPMRRRP